MYHREWRWDNVDRESVLGETAFRISEADIQNDIGLNIKISPV